MKQDEDILDTWFSSALWPFSTLGWPDKTRELSTFYPNNVLVTGPDIIFFWVARMMMMGLHFMGKVPFRTVYLTSIVTDENGDKMSKTKGNVIDPLDVVHGATLETLLERVDVEKPPDPETVKTAIKKNFAKGIPAMGADALRFALAALNTGSSRIRLSIERVEGYRNFINKLWNASRFALMNLDGYDPERFEAQLATPAGQGAARHARALDPVAPAGDVARRSTPRSRRSGSATPRTRSITSCGTSCATGTSSSPSRTCTRPTDSQQDTREGRAPPRRAGRARDGARDDDAAVPSVRAVRHRGDLAEAAEAAAAAGLADDHGVPARRSAWIDAGRRGRDEAPAGRRDRRARMLKRDVQHRRPRSRSRSSCASPPMRRARSSSSYKDMVERRAKVTATITSSGDAGAGRGEGARRRGRPDR